jgi:hypothetical protein
MDRVHYIEEFKCLALDLVTLVQVNNVTLNKRTYVPS